MARIVTTSLLAVLLLAGCGRSPVAKREVRPTASAETSAPSHGITPIALPSAEPKAGVAIVILVDTSGSMVHAVKGKGAKPKHVIAREAIDNIVGHTASWKKAHPERAVQMGVYHFSSHVGAVLPLSDFDEAKARKAVAAIPGPVGGTAIGSALEEGFKALYASGCIRKYLICVTDGENTAGVPPDRVARQLHEQTKGEVEIHFVAFDVASKHFRYVNDVGGHVVQAADGPQLQAELTRIYDQRILLEAEEPVK